MKFGKFFIATASLISLIKGSVFSMTPDPLTVKEETTKECETAAQTRDPVERKRSHQRGKEAKVNSETDVNRETDVNTPSWKKLEDEKSEKLDNFGSTEEMKDKTISTSNQGRDASPLSLKHKEEINSMNKSEENKDKEQSTIESNNKKDLTKDLTLDSDDKSTSLSKSSWMKKDPKDMEGNKNNLSNKKMDE